MPTFIAVNVLLFAISMYVNNCPKNSSSCVAGFLGRFSFQPLKENPLFGPSAATLLKMGALEVSKVTYDHEAWRLITCMWLHAGFIHLVSNMLSLVFIGIRLEQEFGFLRIGPLYIISGIGGSLMSALFIESTISVGASGALFGLLGAMLSELITNWTIYANKFAALLTLVVIIGINLAVGFLPHVDNFAHIGGFMTGFLLGFVLLIRPQFGYVSQKNVPIGYHASAPKKPKYKTYQYILWGISIALLIIGFIVGLVLLFQGFDGHKPCSWCHYLSCVPTSSWSCNKSSKSVSCMSSQIGYQWNLTCSDSGKTKNYLLKDATDAQILELCTQLCT
ncbi:uncharacterized protein A4U43_C05F3370 [Asparagus officinalis]|nr:uncharacterized protein A4U43_C05F3370 [Asparagus officinalis]